MAVDTLAGSDKLELTARRLFDATGHGSIMDNGAVLIEGDRITAVGRQAELPVALDARHIDLGNRTLMPGLVDAHMHFFGVPSRELELIATEHEAYRALRAAGEARRMLEAGITTARCLGSSISPQLRRAINDGHVDGPRIVAAGQFVCSTNGTERLRSRSQPSQPASTEWSCRSGR